jgi:chromosome partitioning protein
MRLRNKLFDKTCAAMEHTCNICGAEFEPHFRYQTEERTELDVNGLPSVVVAHYCSQRCLEVSFRDRTDGSVACEACARSFTVELASQVLFIGGRRHYACCAGCRARVVDGLRAVRSGERLDPRWAADAGESQAALQEEATLPSAAISLGSTSDAAPASDVQASVHSIDERSAEPRAAAPQHKCRIVAVFNHKGGTGKTTTAVHLAAGLAERGRKVLLVDTDGQGNVAVSLGLSVRRSLYHVLVMGMPVPDAVIHARRGLHVLPANETLAAAELYLAGRKNRDRVLATRLAHVHKSYDYVVVDCSPSLSLMNQNALCMADSVLCPVSCDYLSLVGVRQVLGTIKHVNKLLDHRVALWGVLPTHFDVRARICQEAYDTLREHFRGQCFEPIRHSSKVKEAPSQGKTLFEYAPGSTATADYYRVVDRLLNEETRATPRVPRLDQDAIGGVG